MLDDQGDYKDPASEEMHPVAKALFGWAVHPKIGTYIFWGLAGLSFLLIIMDFIYERHPHTEAESYLGFYGFYGFFAFSFVVLMGWPLGRLLRRSETYYDDLDDEGSA